MLAYLAAHPGGATRDAIIEALWRNSAADRPDTAFHTTISRLLKRLRGITGTETTGDLITTSDRRWHVNRTYVTVDYWTFLETNPGNLDPTLRRHNHHIAVQHIMRIHFDNRRREAARGVYQLLRTHLETTDAAPDLVTEQWPLRSIADRRAWTRASTRGADAAARSQPSPARLGGCRFPGMEGKTA